MLDSGDPHFGQTVQMRGRVIELRRNTLVKGVDTTVREHWQSNRRIGSVADNEAPKNSCVANFTAAQLGKTIPSDHAMPLMRNRSVFMIVLCTPNERLIFLLLLFIYFLSSTNNLRLEPRHLRRFSAQNSRIAFRDARTPPYKRGTAAANFCGRRP